MNAYSDHAAAVGGVLAARLIDLQPAQVEPRPATWRAALHIELDSEVGHAALKT
jgi:hypothetical protein